MNKKEKDPPVEISITLPVLLELYEITGRITMPKIIYHAEPLTMANTAIETMLFNANELRERLRKIIYGAD